MKCSLFKSKVLTIPSDCYAASSRFYPIKFAPLAECFCIMLRRHSFYGDPILRGALNG